MQYELEKRKQPTQGVEPWTASKRTTNEAGKKHANHCVMRARKNVKVFNIINLAC